MSQIQIVPVAGRIGAEIRGVKLSADLPHEVAEAIRDAWRKYKVIFFRGQDHLDNASQEALASLFGDGVAHPTVPVAADSRFILELDSHRGGRANSWHTDVTFDVAYQGVEKVSVPRGFFPCPKNQSPLRASSRKCCRVQASIPLPPSHPLRGHSTAAAPTFLPNAPSRNTSPCSVGRCQQIAQPNQVIGRKIQQHLPAKMIQPAQHDAPECADFLHPAKGFLNHLPAPQAHRVVLRLLDRLGHRTASGLGGHVRDHAHIL